MMRQQRRTQICDWCLDYYSGSCADQERIAFERHLPDCPDCQAEIGELRDVWEALPLTMEPMEVPADLKQQVMDALPTADAEQRERKPMRKRLSGRRRMRGIVAAVLLLFVAGTIWNYQLYSEYSDTSVIPLEKALSVSAAQIDQIISLKPQLDGRADAYGIACIVDNGSTKQFVVYVFGAEPTTGDSVYQVWLNDGDNRQSAGTFRVGERGIGLLAMPISAEPPAIDSIGITLEQDAMGASPRGVTVFAS